MKNQISHCPVCRRKDAFQPLIKIDKMPMFCNVQWSDRKSALEAPRGDIHLVFCGYCGHVFNQAFEPGKAKYNSHYENSLHFSPKFQKFAQSLAERLVRRYGILDKTVVEIGCGKGDFLTLLCEVGNNRGIGFDPSYVEERISNEASKKFTVVRDYYSEKYADWNADLVICRHVLEHIESPLAFLEMIYHTARNNPATVIYFEVPNILFTLKDLGIWDIIYEHCGYFSTASLEHVFRTCGFFPISLTKNFGAQFICMEAILSRDSKKRYEITIDKVRELEGYAKSFSAHYYQKVAKWRDRLSSCSKSGEKVVIWGGGSKGVTFLNVMNRVSGISYVVDINPHKKGKFIPGTGQEIVGPVFLEKYKPDRILVMNVLYENEIRKIIDNLKIKTLIEAI